MGDAEKWRILRRAASAGYFREEYRAWLRCWEIFKRGRRTPISAEEQALVDAFRARAEALVGPCPEIWSLLISDFDEGFFSRGAETTPLGRLVRIVHSEDLEAAGERSYYDWRPLVEADERPATSRSDD